MGKLDYTNDLGNFMMHFTNDKEPYNNGTLLLPAYVILYAHHKNFFDRKPNPVLNYLPVPDGVHSFRELADKIIFDASLWNYNFEVFLDATETESYFDGNNVIQDIPLVSHHGDGRIFFYNVYLEAGSVVNVNDPYNPEQLKLIFNTPDNQGAVQSQEQEKFTTSVVHVGPRPSPGPGSADPILNSENLDFVLFKASPVDLYQLSGPTDLDYPQLYDQSKVTMSGYIDRRNSVFDMSLTFIKRAESIVSPPSESDTE